MLTTFESLLVPFPGDAMRPSLMSSFRRNANGGVALMFGVIVPVLIGFAGMAADGVFWLTERNKLQAATDSAAISVAQALQLDGANAALSAEAGKLLGKVYGSNISRVRYKVQNPPASGPLAGDMSAIVVTAEKDQPVFFSALLGMKNVLVTSRSVAKVENMSEACMLALSESADKAIDITGSSALNLGCGIASNSLSSQSVYMSGSSNTAATGVSAAGDIYKSNGSELATSGGPVKSHASPLKDPYGPEGRNLQAPKMPGSCKANNLKVNANTTLTPGRYCGGIDFLNGTATLAPGVYFMDGGAFKAGGQASITGENVTIILTGTGTNAAQLNVNGGAKLCLHAPKSGTATDGILFFQDVKERSCHPGGQAAVGVNTLNGAADLDLSGAMYFPDQALSLSGGTSANISCLQVIANTIKITGNSSITGACGASSGTERMSRMSIELVE